MQTVSVSQYSHNCFPLSILNYYKLVFHSCLEMRLLKKCLRTALRNIQQDRIYLSIFVFFVELLCSLKSKLAWNLCKSNGNIWCTVCKLVCYVCKSSLMLLMILKDVISPFQYKYFHGVGSPSF